MYKPGEAFNDLADYDSGIRKILPHYDLMQNIISSMISRNAKDALELGSGTGELTVKILNNVSGVHMLCVDYSTRMIEFVKNKVNATGHSGRVNYLLHDFRNLDRIEHSTLKKNTLDVCVSMLAIHHLKSKEKLNLIRSVYSLLKPDGQFWIADVLLPSCSNMNQYYAAAREQWNLARDKMASQMISPADYSEPDSDHPDTIQAQLEMFKSAGFRSIDILWKYFGTGVWGGIK
jgi:tRNA (cmo5U34)-methyltransferase